MWYMFGISMHIETLIIRHQQMIKKIMSELELIDIEKFKADCEEFIKYLPDIDINQRSYYITYPEFLEHFRRITKFEKHDVIVGIHLIYGWMPTICHLKSEDFAQVANILNKVKENKKQLVEKELNILRNVFNNSIVGTSKLLHFISPENYPIWDRNVCRYLKISVYKANNTFVYLQYIDTCKYIIEHCKDNNSKNCINSVKNKMKEFELHKENEISDMRAVELVMFTNGQKALKSSSQ
jgi:hypothetical protein